MNSLRNYLFLLSFGILSGFIEAMAFCPRISFEHYYEKFENGSANLTIFENYFPQTLANEFAMMEKLCVDKTGLPIIRRCLGHNQWEELKAVTCQLDLAASELSQSLHQLQVELNEESFYRNSLPNYSKSIVKNMTRIVTQRNHTIQPVDVLNVNKIISIVSKEPKSEAICTEMVGLYNQLVTTDNSVLKLSARLNATNDLLYNFEDYMNKVATNLGPLQNCLKPKSIPMPRHLIDVKVRNGVQILIGDNLSVFYLYPECNQFTGIAIYDRAGPKRRNCSHHRYWYRLLYANQSLSELRSELGLQTATFLTNQLWKELQASGATYLIFKIYANNAFFIETNFEADKANPQGFVLSINIPQVSEQLPHQLVFLLRNERQEELNTEGFLTDSFCGYWNYNTWERHGITTRKSASINDPIVVCYTSHLTQFAFLVGGSLKQRKMITNDKNTDKEEQICNESMLDDVTAFGCGLSWFGLLGIWLTAALSKKWRSMHTTKLLLNLSLAMMLLFGLLLLVYINEWIWHFAFVQNDVGCIALGALLQYSVLLLFSWMLLIGHLQYQRHIIVLVVRSEHVVLRVATIAWLMPLLPTLLLLLIDSTSYSPIQYADDEIATLCYPSGHGLAFGILLPIALVLSVNIYVFIRILYRISRLENRNSQLLWSQLRLFVLLFFLLGLTWIFGICCYFRLGVFLNFLFCITATIQGFVLFVYFVLLDKVARFVWLQILIGKQQSDSIAFEMDS